MSLGGRGYILPLASYKANQVNLSMHFLIQHNVISKQTWLASNILDRSSTSFFNKQHLISNKLHSFCIANLVFSRLILFFLLSYFAKWLQSGAEASQWRFGSNSLQFTPRARCIRWIVVGIRPFWPWCLVDSWWCGRGVQWSRRISIWSPRG